MSSNIKPNKTTALALDTQTIEAVNKYFAKTKSIVVAGTTFTSKTLGAVFQADIDALKALDAGRAAVKQQVATSRAARVQARKARNALRAYILGTAGAQAVQMLEDFGMSAKTGIKTVAVKAQAITKAQATREANKPAGKQQLPAGTGLAQGATTASTEASTAPQAQVAAPAANATHA